MGLRKSRPSFTLCSYYSVFRTTDSSRACVPAWQAGRGHHPLSLRGKKPLFFPSAVHYTLPAPPLRSLLTSPSHIRSSDWPIKYRKYVSIDECSAQAEKAECGAEPTSSSTTRTADIPQRASTIRAYPCLDFGHILHEI
ncbi:hypothetical protein PBY51_013232 [Eleginops maclovinus]|uniref:Uncharacterized protein n=1 Tax=Eleginops maclovinus TaxID=56733 RepID=A0AAN8AXQ4_ELEMC|nr:hypothetical protein PBY51_013232 [Eleginops maclovinus]